MAPFKKKIAVRFDAHLSPCAVLFSRSANPALLFIFSRCFSLSDLPPPSHFAPLDWRGPNDSNSPTYYGYVKGRCDTIADDGGVSSCLEQNGKADGAAHTIELDFGPKVRLPAAGAEPSKPFAMADYSGQAASGAAASHTGASPRAEL